MAHPNNLTDRAGNFRPPFPIIGRPPPIIEGSLQARQRDAFINELTILRDQHFSGMIAHGAHGTHGNVPLYAPGGPVEVNDPRVMQNHPGYVRQGQGENAHPSFVPDPQHQITHHSVTRDPHHQPAFHGNGHGPQHQISHHAFNHGLQDENVRPGMLQGAQTATTRPDLPYGRHDMLAQVEHHHQPIFRNIGQLGLLPPSGPAGPDMIVGRVPTTMNRPVQTGDFSFVPRAVYENPPPFGAPQMHTLPQSGPASTDADSPPPSAYLRARQQGLGHFDAIRYSNLARNRHELLPSTVYTPPTRANVTSQVMPAPQAITTIRPTYVPSVPQRIPGSIIWSPLIRNSVPDVGARTDVGNVQPPIGSGRFTSSSSAMSMHTTSSPDKTTTGDITVVLDTAIIAGSGAQVVETAASPEEPIVSALPSTDAASALSSPTTFAEVLKTGCFEAPGDELDRVNSISQPLPFRNLGSLIFQVAQPRITDGSERVSRGLQAASWREQQHTKGRFNPDPMQGPFYPLGDLDLRHYPRRLSNLEGNIFEQEQEHADNFWKIYRSREDLIEIYYEATEALKFFNPEFLQMGVGSVVVNIKVDDFDSMIYAIRNGFWTNPANVNARITTVWDELKRVGSKPRVFFLFSVCGSKQFCAVAEMVAPIDTARSIEGWRKDSCTGIIPLRFLYVKNVPFTNFVDLPNKNGIGTVLNVWNGMVFDLAQGREVLERYVKYPHLRNVLVFRPIEGPLPNFPAAGRTRFSYNRSAGVGKLHSFLREAKKLVRAEDAGSVHSEESSKNSPPVEESAVRQKTASSHDEPNEATLTGKGKEPVYAAAPEGLPTTSFQATCEEDNSQGEGFDDSLGPPRHSEYAFIEVTERKTLTMDQVRAIQNPTADQLVQIEEALMADEPALVGIPRDIGKHPSAETLRAIEKAILPPSPTESEVDAPAPMYGHCASGPTGYQRPLFDHDNPPNGPTGYQRPLFDHDNAPYTPYQPSPNFERPERPDSVPPFIINGPLPEDPFLGEPGPRTNREDLPVWYTRTRYNEGETSFNYKPPPVFDIRKCRDQYYASYPGPQSQPFAASAPTASTPPGRAKAPTDSTAATVRLDNNCRAADTKSKSSGKENIRSSSARVEEPNLDNLSIAEKRSYYLMKLEHLDLLEKIAALEKKAREPLDETDNGGVPV